MKYCDELDQDARSVPRSGKVPRSRSGVLLLQQWVTQRMNGGASDDAVKTRHWSDAASARLAALPPDTSTSRPASPLCHSSATDARHSLTAPHSKLRMEAVRAAGQARRVRAMSERAGTPVEELRGKSQASRCSEVSQQVLAPRLQVSRRAGSGASGAGPANLCLPPCTQTYIRTWLIIANKIAS